MSTFMAVINLRASIDAKTSQTKLKVSVVSLFSPEWRKAGNVHRRLFTNRYKLLFCAQSFVAPNCLQIFAEISMPKPKMIISGRLFFSPPSTISPKSCYYVPLSH